MRWRRRMLRRQRRARARDAALARDIAAVTGGVATIAAAYRSLTAGSAIRRGDLVLLGADGLAYPARPLTSRDWN